MSGVQIGAYVLFLVGGGIALFAKRMDKKLKKRRQEEKRAAERKEIMMQELNEGFERFGCGM